MNWNASFFLLNFRNSFNRKKIDNLLLFSLKFEASRQKLSSFWREATLCQFSESKFFKFSKSRQKAKKVDFQKLLHSTSFWIFRALALFIVLGEHKKLLLHIFEARVKNVSRV